MEPVIIFWFIVIPLLLIVLPLIGMALPPAVRQKSLKRFFIAVVISAIGILLPLYVFVVSIFCMPEWKGGCEHGWLDCFHLGKLALAPLVLWACAAFYTIQVLRPANTHRTWIVLGIFTGAIVSSVCFVVGLVTNVFRHEMLWWFM